MKYLVLGLFSLALLGFVCAQSQNPSPRPTTAMESNNTTNTTGSFNYNMTGNNGNNGNNVYNSKPTGNNPISNQMPTTLPTTLTGNSPTMTGTGNSPSMNGQSHIFASTSLLFGSFALQALWQ
ncbi:putative mediator of RNA polymerase II transcription subunit 29 [Lates japonicus]